MRARIKGLTLSLDGGQELTLSLPGDWRDEYMKLKDADVDVEIKKHREKRSRGANALLWAICTEIAEELSKESPITKEEVYKRAVREVGVYTPVPIKETAVETFVARWAKQGIAWFAEVVDGSKIPNYKLVFIYYGSSTYSVDEMSKLLDYVVDEAKQIGLTLRASEKEIEEAKRRWGDA